MESIKVYEKSLQEINKVRKQLASTQVIINMIDLDGQTKQEVTYALAEVLSKRQREVTQVITNNTEV